MSRNLLNIIEEMNETPLVFDGAMGTVIYERGVFVNSKISSVDNGKLGNEYFLYCRTAIGTKEVLTQ